MACVLRRGSTKIQAWSGHAFDAHFGETKMEKKVARKKSERYRFGILVGLLICNPLLFQPTAHAQQVGEAFRKTVIRGVVQPVREAAISTELTSLVAKVPFREGENFNEGDLLMSFNCSKQQAELRAADAASRAKLIDWKNKRELLRYKAIGSNEVKLAEAAFAEARARAEALKIQTTHCEVFAPFTGRVVERVVNPHEMPNIGEPLLRLISDNELELDLIVPSTWLVWLKAGETFDFEIDETGKTHTARVKQIGAAVDPVSQTIKIKGVFERPDSSVLSGMSGTATFHKSDS